MTAPTPGVDQTATIELLSVLSPYAIENSSDMEIYEVEFRLWTIKNRDSGILLV
jgi:hypothetical protein